jgi:DNA-binding response OmpR family regulator
MKKEILAIDDSKAVRFLLQSILSREYRVVTMPDGHSAMYWLSRGNRPDLIIADPQLPDMPDWELVRKLAPGYTACHSDLLVLSGLKDGETRNKCMEFGVKTYLLKPFYPSVLLFSINRMLSAKPHDVRLN